MFAGFYTHDGVTSLLVLTPHIRLQTSWRDCGAGQGKTRCRVWQLSDHYSSLLHISAGLAARSSLAAPSKGGAGGFGGELKAFQQPGWSKWHHHQTSPSLVEWDDRPKCPFKKDTNIHFHLKSSLLLHLPLALSAVRLSWLLPSPSLHRNAIKADAINQPD